jgi:ATP-dependent RNA helicase DDX54/DBP10
MIDGDSGGVSSSIEMNGYTLQTMTPKMVHTGLLPQDAIDQENDFLKRSLADNDQLQILLRISENGMMQYRKTRSEASRTGIKLAKASIKEDKISSIHPLIIGCDPDKCNENVIAKATFVKQLQTFRPAQTVFETGIGMGTSSKAIKMRAKKGSAESHGVEVMKALRKEVSSALERNKEKVTLIQDNLKMDNDNDDLMASNGDLSENEDDIECMKDEYDEVEEDANDAGANDDLESCGGMSKSDSVFAPTLEKKRMSRATRKQLKRQAKQIGGNENDLIKQSRKVNDRASSLGGNTVIIETNGSSSSMSGNSKESKATGNRFKDPKFYMTYGTENEVLNFVEDSLQPQSGLRSGELQVIHRLPSYHYPLPFYYLILSYQGAAMLESALLDLAPDEALEMNRKRKMLRWDAKKRKFVKVPLQAHYITWLIVPTHTANPRRIFSEKRGV